MDAGPRPDTAINPAGAIGRPAFGVGPIARVTRPSTGQVHARSQRTACQGAEPATVRSDRRPNATIGTPAGAPAIRAPRRIGRGCRAAGVPPPHAAARHAAVPRRLRPAEPAPERLSPLLHDGSRGAIPIQAPHLLKALIRQDANVSRCQLRGGVHLEQGYVNDVCLTPRFNQCVFYEDDLTRE